jgi:hypothetical protein
MAATKVSALPVASSLTGTELIPVVQGGVTKSAAASLLAGGTISASSVVFSPSGTIVATNVQTALEELDSEMPTLAQLHATALSF